MSEKLVSILIPVYNRENLIQETVESALSQEYKNIEIIIVDNKSTDGTWELLKKLSNKDKRIKIYQNETNIGPVRNWKRCIDEASGIYGKILWSDDLIVPTFLEETLPLLKKDVAFVYTAVKVFSEDVSTGTDAYRIGKTGYYPTKQFIKGTIFGNEYPVSATCALFRLSDLKKNTLINIPNKIHSDTAMHAIGSDLLMFLLTAKSYTKFGFISEQRTYFRAHEGSITTSSKSGRLPLHYALAKAYYVENYDPHLKPKLAAYILLLLKKYKNSGEYGINQVSDYFFKPVTVSIVMIFLIYLDKIKRYI